MTTPASGRTGNALSITGASTNFVVYTIPAPNESDLVTIGFAWRTNTTSASTRDIFSLYSDSGATRHARLVYQGTTNQSLSAARDTSTLATSATGLIPVNTWAYIEAQIKLGDAPNGYFVVRVNGTQVINATGIDTKNAGTKTVFDRLRLTTALSGVTNLWDDLYLTMGAGTFKGDITVP